MSDDINPVTGCKCTFSQRMVGDGCDICNQHEQSSGGMPDQVWLSPTENLCVYRYNEKDTVKYIRADNASGINEGYRVMELMRVSLINMIDDGDKIDIEQAKQALAEYEKLTNTETKK